MEKMNWKKAAGRYLLSAGFGLGVTVVAAMVFAYLVAGQVLPQSAMGWGAMVPVILGSAVSAVLWVMKYGGWSLVFCLGAGMVYLLGLTICGLVLFGKLGNGFLPTAALSLGSAMAVGLLGKRGGRKPAYRVPKLRV